MTAGACHRSASVILYLLSTFSPLRNQGSRSRDREGSHHLPDMGSFQGGRDMESGLAVVPKRAKRRNNSKGARRNNEMGRTRRGGRRANEWRRLFGMSYHPPMPFGQFPAWAPASVAA